jgi:hypothetical protein
MKSTSLKQFMTKRSKQAYLKHKSHNVTVNWPKLHLVAPTTTELPPYIECKGNCHVLMHDIDEALLSKEYKNLLVVHAWINGEATVAHVDSNNEFTIQVPIDPKTTPTELIKLGVCMTMLDPESGMQKNFPIQTTCFNIHDLVQQQEAGVVQHVEDAFNTSLKSTIELSCVSKDIPLDKFKPSPLRQAEKYNQALEGLGAKITGVFNQNNIRPPRCAIPFMEGLTYAPFNGMPTGNIPALHAHYALFGAHINHLDRKFPLALPCYFLVTALAHSTHTMQEVNDFIAKGCQSREYIQMVADAVFGFTKDAMCASYQRDGTPVIALDNKTHKVVIGIETTEDINIVGHAVALETECNVDLDDEVAADVSVNTSMADLRKCFDEKEWMVGCVGNFSCIIL